MAYVIVALPAYLMCALKYSNRIPVIQFVNRLVELVECVKITCLSQKIFSAFSDFFLQKTISLALFRPISLDQDAYLIPQPRMTFMKLHWILQHFQCITVALQGQTLEEISRPQLQFALPLKRRRQPIIPTQLILEASCL